MSYKSDIKNAYDMGYKAGWDMAHKIPKSKGASSSASVGFKSGIDNRRKRDVYNNRYNKRIK